jgi:hypothetical protein
MSMGLCHQQNEMASMAKMNESVMSMIVINDRCRDRRPMAFRVNQST